MPSSVDVNGLKLYAYLNVIVIENSLLLHAMCYDSLPMHGSWLMTVQGAIQLTYAELHSGHTRMCSDRLLRPIHMTSGRTGVVRLMHNVWPQQED